jgi:hypothetical protein
MVFDGPKLMNENDAWFLWDFLFFLDLTSTDYFLCPIVLLKNEVDPPLGTLCFRLSLSVYIVLIFWSFGVFLQSLNEADLVSTDCFLSLKVLGIDLDLGSGSLFSFWSVLNEFKCERNV